MGKYNPPNKTFTRPDWNKSRIDLHLKTSIICCLVHKNYTSLNTNKHVNSFLLVSHMRQWTRLGEYWFRCLLVACSAPSHYLNKFCLIVSWTLGKTLQWNWNQNAKAFIHEREFENVCELVIILARPRCVKLKLNFLRSCYVIEGVVYMLSCVWPFPNKSQVSVDKRMAQPV